MAVLYYLEKCYEKRLVSVVVVFCVGLLWDLRQSVLCVREAECEKGGFEESMGGWSRFWMLFGQQRYCVLGIASSSSAELFLVLSRFEHRALSIIIDHTVSCSILYKTPTTSRLTAFFPYTLLIILTLTSLIILSSAAAADLPISATPITLNPLLQTSHPNSPSPPNSSSPSSPANRQQHPPALHQPPPTRFKEPSQAISQHDPRDRILEDLVCRI